MTRNYYIICILKRILLLKLNVIKLASFQTWEFSKLTKSSIFLKCLNDVGEETILRPISFAYTVKEKTQFTHEIEAVRM